MDLTVIRLTVAIAVVMFSLLAFDYAVLVYQRRLDTAPVAGTEWIHPIADRVRVQR